MSSNSPTIIDCHHHVGTLDAHGMNFAADVDPRASLSLDLDLRVSVMDRQGVDQAIIIPGHGYLRPNGIADTRLVNNSIAAFRDLSPLRFPAAVGIAEPLHGGAGIDELHRMSAELGLVGLSVHARFQGVQTDSPHVVALVRKAAELRLVPFIHAMDGIPDESIWRVQQVAREVPETTIIVLDALNGVEQARHATLLAADTPNLVFDTSFAYHYMFVAAMLDVVGPERVVFGTDYYSMMPDPQPSVVLDYFASHEVPIETRAAVLGGNLQRILALGHDENPASGSLGE